MCCICICGSLWVLPQAPRPRSRAPSPLLQAVHRSSCQTCRTIMEHWNRTFRARSWRSITRNTYVTRGRVLFCLYTLPPPSNAQHQAYVTNLNVAMEKYLKAEAAGDVAEMISLQVGPSSPRPPLPIIFTSGPNVPQGAIRFNGGGHVNHSIFWQNLAPPGRGGGGEPSGSLKTAIDARFGSFASLKTQLNSAGAGVQVGTSGATGPPPLQRLPPALCWPPLVSSMAGLWLGVARAQQGCGRPPRPPHVREPGPCLVRPRPRAYPRHRRLGARVL